MPEQRTVATMHQHDDSGVSSGKMLRLAGSTLHDVAGTAHVAHAAADAAEAMARPPVHQPARMRQHRGFRLRHTPADRAQIDEFPQLFRQQRHRVVRGADIHGEHRVVVQHAQEGPRSALHAQRVRGLAGDVHCFRRTVLHPAYQVAAAPHRHEQRVRIGQALLDPFRVFPPRRDAVERTGRIHVRATGEDQCHSVRSRALGMGVHDGAMPARRQQP